jgi:hypothetical protein
VPGTGVVPGEGRMGDVEDVHHPLLCQDAAG